MAKRTTTTTTTKATTKAAKPTTTKRTTKRTTTKRKAAAKPAASQPAPANQAQATLPGQQYAPTQPTAKSVVRDFARQPSARTIAKLQSAAQHALAAAPKGAAEFKVLPAHCAAGGIAPGWVSSTPKNRYQPGGFSSRAWQAAGYTVVRYTRGVCLVLTPNK